MNRSHKRSPLRQEELIDAALALIAEGGLAALTTQALSRRVGLVPSALYRHFRDMQALLDAVLDTVFERVHGLVDAATAAGGPALAQLHAVFSAHIDLIGDNPGIPLLIFSQEVSGGPAARRERVLAGLERYLARIATLIRQAQEQGEAAPHRDPQALAMLYLGLVQPAALMQVLSAGRWDLAGHARAVWPRFRDALGAAVDRA